MKALKALILTSSIMLTACGSDPQIIYVYPQDMQQQQGMQPGMAQSSLQSAPQDYSQADPAAMPMANTPAPRTATTAKPGTTGVSTSAKTTAAKTSAGTTATAGSSTEDKLLKKARDSFMAIQGITATVKTFESSSTGDGTGLIKLNYKKPSSIKVDILNSTTSGQAGAKFAYNDPNQVQVRPTGMLSVVSVSLAMNDPKILSGRKYQLNQIDLSATVTRLTQPGTKAKLIGQSTVAGSQVYVLEVDAPQKLDPTITREVLSLDAKTFLPRMHEMYVGTKKVYAVEVDQININPSFGPDDFNV